MERYTSMRKIIQTLCPFSKISIGIQVHLRSYVERDGTQATPGQRRIKADLERIKREKDREPDREELTPPQHRPSNSVSPRQSLSGPSEVNISLSNVIQGKPMDFYILKL